jgi:ABC-type transporter Mla MlaB component
VEDGVKIHMNGSMAHLQGDWTVAGVTQNNLDTLSVALELIEPGDGRSLNIDCQQVRAIDTTGKQILNVWLQCARLRGVEPELVNPPNKLRHFFKG